MSNEDLETIITHLNRLTVQQQRLTQQVSELLAELQTDIWARQPNNNDILVEEPQVRRIPEGRRRRTSIAVGDRVRVKNPGRNQPNTGTIHSYTPSRLFVKIKLDNCDLTINRAPRNVTRIEP